MWIPRGSRGLLAHLDCQKVRSLVLNWPHQTPFHLNSLALKYMVYGLFPNPTLGFRAYPLGFARKMLEAVESHLGKGAGRHDLRFKPQKNQHLTEMEQFEKLGLDDPWEDANMLELLDYLMTSKRVRTE